MYACSCHQIPIRDPGSLSDPSHRYSSDRVAMYCATVFCRSLMYCSIIWNPASSLAVAAKVFSHLPSVFSYVGRLISRRATWSWKPPRTLIMQGVTTQVSEKNSITSCTTDLKKKTDTRVSAPSLLRILVVLFLQDYVCLLLPPNPHP